MDLKTPLYALPGVGPATAQKLEKLHLNTVEDLINYYPFRYDDFSNTTKIADAKVGEKVTLTGQIWQIQNVYTKFKKIITKAILNDGTSSIILTWFNQPYLTKSILVGNTLHVAGTVGFYGNKLSIMAPQWEKNDDPLHTGRLVPIYSETAGITSKWIRTLTNKVLNFADQIPEYLPNDIKDGMEDLSKAIKEVHFPSSLENLQKARMRLSFDELFLIQLATQRTRLLWQQKSVTKAWKIAEKDLAEFLKTLPFQLTDSQLKVLEEIISDLKKDIPMNRLLQGEVGSGKTIVATAAMYLCFKNGFQSLFMAPTEILAWQHFETVKKYLEPMGVKIGIYTGSRKFTVIARSKTTWQSASGEDRDPIARDDNKEPDIIIGTHALLSEKLKVQNVGLVIIDEQHRFGVEQRSILRQKSKTSPHFLTMTATPIPRTVALTLYGDLELSIIGELPKNRPVIKTHLVPEEKRNDAYKFITKKVLEGDQVYIITPLIELAQNVIPANAGIQRAQARKLDLLENSRSEVDPRLRGDDNDFENIKAAKSEYERLQKVFPKFKLGLLHGKMKPKEKEAVLQEFRDNKVQILVSTSVVEVGVDVPNATIMIIEGAERFGLAQLHQLRGRIGRGTKESFCLLFTETKDAQESIRLKHLETTFDGLKLAELDMKLRGGGAIFSTQQHGSFDLKIAEFSNLELIERASSEAKKILAHDPQLDNYPPLKAKLSSLADSVMPD